MEINPPAQNPQKFETNEVEVEIKYFKLPLDLISLIQVFKNDKSKLKQTEIIESILGDKKVMARFADPDFVTRKVKKQLKLGQGFKKYQETLKLESLYCVKLVMHERSFLNKLISTLLLSKNYAIHFFQIHPRFSILYFAKTSKPEEFQKLTLHLFSESQKLNFPEFWQILKPKTFEYPDFMRTIFEGCEFEINAKLNNDEEFKFGIYDLENGNDKMMVHIFSNCLIDFSRKEISQQVISNATSKRIVFVEGKLKSHFSINSVFQKSADFLKLLNPINFNPQSEVTANPNDVGISRIIFENEEMLIEELEMNSKNSKRRLIFKNSMQYFQSELLIKENVPDFLDVDFEVYHRFMNQLISSKPETDKVFNVCILGGGCGVLMNFLSASLPNYKFCSVEIRPEIKKLAEKFFFLEEKDNLKFIIADAIDFLKTNEASLMDVFLIDVDDKNGVSPPSIFLAIETVQKMLKIKKENGGQGFIGVNCDYADKSKIVDEIGIIEGVKSVVVEECGRLNNYVLIIR